MASSDFEYVNIPISGALTVAAGVARYSIPFASELVQVNATVNTAPVGSSIIFDINKNGTTVISSQSAPDNRLTILAAANAAVPLKVTRGVAVNPGPGTNQPNDTGVGYVNITGNGVVPNDTPVATFAAGDYVSIDVDQIGSGTAGSNAVITLVLNKK